MKCQRFRIVSGRLLATAEYSRRPIVSPNASKTQAARANAFSMRLKRWRVAALFESRNRVAPFGRTRMAARWKTSNRSV